MAEPDYIKLYEQEQEKLFQLSERLSDAENENKMLRDELDQIRSSMLWRITSPIRKFSAFVKAMAWKMKACGSLKGVLKKIRDKIREKRAYILFGTSSFPNAETAQQQRIEQFPRMVKISILVPLYNTPDAFLKDMLDSVMNQTYQNWELCLADGSDDAHANVGIICKEYAARANGRILYHKLEENKGIAGNTNACLDLASGEYIGLLDHDDVLHPSALYEYVKAINAQNAEYLYCDEVIFRSPKINRFVGLHLKPDFAPDFLMSINYICHFSVFSRKLLEGEVLFQAKYDGSQDHDMAIRLTSKADKIVHIPKVLYYWRSHAGSVAYNTDQKPYAADAARAAIKDFLEQKGFANVQVSSLKKIKTFYRVRYQIVGTPMISILIPNRDHADDLRRCISSLIGKSAYCNYEIIVIENGSESDAIKQYYTELLGYSYEDTANLHEPKQPDDPRDGGVLISAENSPLAGRIKIVKYNGGFNFSAINNIGERYAAGDYILLLNNDTEVITASWLEEMLMFAQREDVGAVGAKLLFQNDTVQHAGVILGMGTYGAAGHCFYGAQRDDYGYMARLAVQQNYSAVTGACLMVKKRDYDAVGGLDESFVVALNDVDFCLKLREKGLLNVFTPFAELYHYESLSRGSDETGANAERYHMESERFCKKWKAVLDAGDPYYNPNLSLKYSFVVDWQKKYT